MVGGSWCALKHLHVAVVDTEVGSSMTPVGALHVQCALHRDTGGGGGGGSQFPEKRCLVPIAKCPPRVSS